MWQGRATQLLMLLLPDRVFPASLDWDAEWPALIDEARKAARTDARLELAQQSLEQRKAKAEAARAKLSKDELAALGL